MFLYVLIIKSNYWRCTNCAKKHHSSSPSQVPLAKTNVCASFKQHLKHPYVETALLDSGFSRLRFSLSLTAGAQNIASLQQEVGLAKPFLFLSIQNSRDTASKIMTDS